MQEQLTNIKEIFSSIQGEGCYLGQKHVFVRFCKCNLACKFCDTDFNIKNSKEYSTSKLFKELIKYDCDTVSFTGGEPLCDVDFLEEFLKKYKEKLNKKIYLETNGTLYQNLERIIDFLDVIAMDIKLESATSQKNCFFDNEKFLDISSKKEVFIKIVFDKNIKDYEIENCTKIARKYNIPTIIQPKMPLDNNIDLIKIYDKFYSNYKNIRLIPQVHKFLNFK